MNNKLQHLINLVNSKDNMDLLEYLINNCGPQLPLIKVPSNIVPGCISKIYLSNKYIDGKLYFEVTSDSKIIQGMGRLLCDLFNGSTADEIQCFQFSELAQLKYTEWLTNSRQNGFKQIFIKIKQIAQLQQDKDLIKEIL